MNLPTWSNDDMVRAATSATWSLELTVALIDSFLARGRRGGPHPSDRLLELRLKGERWAAACELRRRGVE